MDFHVSLIGRKNLRDEIYRQVRRAITDGRLRPGDLLPPSRELARTLDVSRTTVVAAYDRLAGEGYLTARIGSGTRVSEWLPAAPSRKNPRAAGALVPHPRWDAVALSTVFLRPTQFDFRTGIPDASLFPYDAWRRLITRQLRAVTASGAYDHPAGLRELREAIARHIGVSRGLDVSPQEVTVTNGTQQALDLLARVLLDPGDIVAIEDPCYSPARFLFESHGARIHGIPVDAEGLVVNALPDDARCVYVTPSHQYPLGVSMSMPRRLALLEWAKAAGAAIIEDDYDTEFRFRERPIEPLRTLDDAGRVIYVGSFSKTLHPALRLGFAVVPLSLREAIHKAKYLADWHTSTVLQASLAHFIESGSYARHIRKAGSAYQQRRTLILSTLADRFAGLVDVLPAAAGLHVTAMAHDRSVQEIAVIAERASAAGVEVQTVARFTVAQPALAGLMLGYGAIPPGRIEEGLQRLRACFDARS